MRSRVHPKYKTKYLVTNRAEYDQSLVERGIISLWITPAAIAGEGGALFLGAAVGNWQNLSSVPESVRTPG